MSTNILILTNDLSGRVFFEDSPYMEELEKEFPTCNFTLKKVGEETEEDVQSYEIITGHPNPKFLQNAKNLKWLHLQSAGVNGYNDLASYGNPNILLTRTGDCFGATMAEHAVGMMIAITRSFPLYVRQGVKHEWHRHDTHIELAGSTVLMLGAGDIAQQLIKKLSGFDCHIIGVRRDITKPAEGYDKMYSSEELHSALKEADYIFNILPATDATKNYLDKAEFAVMKDRAILINLGRGDTVNHDALVSALQNNKIYGAGLDVTSPEPLPEESPLWDMPNVLITPHSAGLSDGTDRRRLDLFKKELHQYLNGEKLDYIVDFSAGY